MKRLTIDDLKRIAKNRDGKILSTHYVNRKSKVFWECKDGHRWDATVANVKMGKWCPKCAIEKRAKKLRSTIEELHKIAGERNGKCLSKEYINGKTHVRWECINQHRWMARPDRVKKGSWCPICAGQHQTIEDMRELARECGGKCLSKNYSGMKTKLIWQCKKRHQWQARPDNIKQGTWCPICARNNRKQSAYNQKVTKS